MKMEYRSSYWLIYASLFLALILMIAPIPSQWQWQRPEWLSLILIYWVLREPSKVKVLTGWSFGLMMDILANALIGQYALTMAVLVYLTQLLRNRMRFFLFWQELIVVLILIGFAQLILVIIEWLIGHPPRTVWYWSSTLLSIVFWPLINRVLQLKVFRSAL